MTTEVYKDGRRVIEFSRVDDRWVESFVVEGGFVIDVADYPELLGSKPNDLIACAWIKREGTRPMSRSELLDLTISVAQGIGAVDTGIFGGSSWSVKKTKFTPRLNRR